MTCMMLKRALHFIIVLISACTGWLCCESTPKDGKPDPRESLVNKIPSHTIEQANREVQQEYHHSQHTSNQVSNA